MPVNKELFKLICLGLLSLLLYGFSVVRQNGRSEGTLEIKILNPSELYISEEMVNKLLIQNKEDFKNAGRDRVVLNSYEGIISKHPHVRKAELFKEINGNIIAEIQQKKPWARVISKHTYYLDSDGNAMPLSRLHSAKVPLISGHISDESLHDVYQILSLTRQDKIFENNIVGVEVLSKGHYQLRLRSHDFVVDLGDANALPSKLEKFKAFFWKASKDKVLNNYAAVNLAYKNQVVCTKI